MVLIEECKVTKFERKQKWKPLKISIKEKASQWEALFMQSNFLIRICKPILS